MMASFNEPDHVKREGILTRILRFLGLNSSKKENRKLSSNNISEEQAAESFKSGQMAFYDFFDDKISEILILSQPEGLEPAEFETTIHIDGKIKNAQGKLIQPTAYIESGGMLHQDNKQIIWLIDKVSNLPPNPFKPLTVYRIRVRKASSVFSDNKLLLVKIVDSGVHNTQLEDVREEYLRPVWYIHTPWVDSNWTRLQIILRPV